MLIGQLADQSGFTRDTLRYYEKLGLIHPDARRPGNYREYGTRTLTILRFIRKSKALGFTLNEIKDMIRVLQDRSYSCEKALRVVDRKRKEIDAEMARLRKHRKNLNELVAVCGNRTQSDSCRAFEKLWGDEPIGTGNEKRRGPGTSPA